MEELGGNEKWGDRAIAQHAAFFYYWMVVALYMMVPAVAYNLNEQVSIVVLPLLPVPLLLLFQR